MCLQEKQVCSQEGRAKSCPLSGHWACSETGSQALGGEGAEPGRLQHHSTWPQHTHTLYLAVQRCVVCGCGCPLWWAVVVCDDCSMQPLPGWNSFLLRIFRRVVFRGFAYCKVWYLLRIFRRVVLKRDPEGDVQKCCRPHSWTKMTWAHFLWLCLLQSLVLRLILSLWFQGTLEAPNFCASSVSLIP